MTTPALVCLQDLQALRVRAMRAGYNMLHKPTWDTDKIVAALAGEAEKLGFYPRDPQLLHELRHQVESGMRARVKMDSHTTNADPCPVIPTQKAAHEK